MPAWDHVGMYCDIVTVLNRCIWLACGTYDICSKLKPRNCTGSLAMQSFAMACVYFALHESLYKSRDPLNIIHCALQMGNVMLLYFTFVCPQDARVRERF